MRLFTQVAYADLEDARNYLAAKYPNRTNFTISELEAVAIKLDPNCQLDSLKCLSNAQKNAWTISAVYDTNIDTGFYACVIETSPGNAVLAFRGSEDYHDLGNLKHDWLDADLGLLNNTQTLQHSEVEKFLADNNDLINSYDNILLTGHSLGGNLADYATLVSHKYGFNDRIDQCINFDGPGFSNEFIENHIVDINRMNGVMTHYKWSLVGNMLFPIPGAKQLVCELTDDADVHIVTRHDTKYLKYDANGNVIPGNKDILSMFFDYFSKNLDIALGSGGLISLILMGYSVFGGLAEDFKSFFNQIAENSKKTYKDFKKALEYFFGIDSGYLKVNTSRLSSDAEAARERIDRARDLINNMFISVQKLNGMWRGKANQAYVKKFANEKAAIESYLKHIEKYISKIERDNSAYNKCEATAVNIVSAIRV